MMAKECRDFLFHGKSMSDLSTKYIFVNFESDPDIVLGMSRDMESGETTRYKTEPNYFYDKWSDTLSLEFNIIKNPCNYESQNDLEITEEEIREITRWLTSSHYPDWLKCTGLDGRIIRYKGWFNNIETFAVSHTVYGLKLYFKCTTAFGYTEEMTNEITVSSYDTLFVNNDSDELESYCYPTLEIYPNANGEIYICNLDDCTIREEGLLTLTQTGYFNSMLDVIEEHAKLNGCEVEYVSNDPNSAFNITPLCNETAVQFYLVDVYGNKNKCTAFYLNDTKEYKIIENGFMYMTVYKDLNIYLDCQKLIINDGIGRMITYDKLGIGNVDHLYWLRLVHGENALLLYGNCNFKVKHIESRKVGE